MPPLRLASRLVASLGCLVLAFGAAIGAGQAQPDGKDSVIIGVGMGLSSTYGQQSKRGIDLAVKEVNEAGGVLGGRKVEVVAYDDENKPEQAVAVFERLFNSDHVRVAIGPVTTTCTAAAMPVSKRYGKVQIAHAGAGPRLRDDGGPSIFFLNGTVAMNGANFDAFVANTLKLKRVAVLAEQSDYGEGAIATLKNDWSTADSPKMVEIDRIDPKDTDFTPVLTRIKGENPDGLYIAIGTLETFSAVLRQAKELGIDARILPAPGAVSAAGLLQLFGKEDEEMVEGLIFADFYSNLVDTPENRAFVDAFSKAYGYPPDKLELTGYEAVRIAAAAIDRAGANASDEQLAHVIRDTTWSTPRGTWKFKSMGSSYQAPSSPVLLTIKNGKITSYP